MKRCRQVTSVIYSYALITLSTHNLNLWHKNTFLLLLNSPGEISESSVYLQITGSDSPEIIHIRLKTKEIQTPSLSISIITFKCSGTVFH